MRWRLVGFVARDGNSSQPAIVGDYQIQIERYLPLVHLLCQIILYRRCFSNFRVLQFANSFLSLCSYRDSIYPLSYHCRFFQRFREPHSFERWWSRFKFDYLQFLSWSRDYSRSAARPDYPPHHYIHLNCRIHDIRCEFAYNKRSCGQVRSFLQYKISHTNLKHPTYYLDP